MSELTDFERGQNFGARLEGTSIKKMAKVFMVSRGTVSKLYSAYLKFGKTSSAKSQRGGKCALSDRDRRKFKRIVIIKKTTAAKVTAEMNTQLTNSVRTK